nr:unnamed protein product [Callosobruchus analis]
MLHHYNYPTSLGHFINYHQLEDTTTNENEHATPSSCDELTQDDDPRCRSNSSAINNKSFTIAAILGLKGDGQDPRTCRPILVQFIAYKMKSLLSNKKKLLKKTPYVIKEDLTSENIRLMKSAIGRFGLTNVWSLDGNIYALDEFFGEITSSNDYVFCLGDFNVNYLNVSGTEYKWLTDFFSIHNFEQIVSMATRVTAESCTLLDHIWTNASRLVTHSETIFIPELRTDHHLVYCFLDIQVDKSQTNYIYTRNLKGINMSNFENHALRADWNYLISLPDIELKVSYLENIINTLFNVHAPIRKIKITKKCCPWVTPNIKLMMKARDLALSEYRRSLKSLYVTSEQSKRKWNTYKELRNYVTAAIRREKKAFIESNLKNNIRNSKLFWNSLTKLDVHKKLKIFNLPDHLMDPDKINSHFINSVNTTVADPLTVAYFNVSRHEKFNEDLQSIYHWSVKNALQLNPNKTTAMLIGNDTQCSKVNFKDKIILNNITIQTVNECKSLGVILDTRLSFTAHINGLIKKTYGKIKSLYRFKYILSTETKLKICDSLIVSTFDYCDVVYGPSLSSQNTHRLQVVQNVCMRFSTNTKKREHITPLYIKQWNKLDVRRKYITVSGIPEYLYRKLVFAANIQDRSRRDPFLLQIPRHNTSYFQNSFSYLCAALYNPLPIHMKIEIGASVPIIRSFPRPRWNFGRANWHLFAEKLDKRLGWIAPKYKNYKRFIGAVISSAKEAIPRGYRKEYVPGWNEHSEQLYNEFVESGDREMVPPKT